MVTRLVWCIFGRPFQIFTASWNGSWAALQPKSRGMHNSAFVISWHFVFYLSFRILCVEALQQLTLLHSLWFDLKAWSSEGQVEFRNSALLVKVFQKLFLKMIGFQIFHLQSDTGSVHVSVCQILVIFTKQGVYLKYDADKSRKKCCVCGIPLVEINCFCEWTDNSCGRSGALAGAHSTNLAFSRGILWIFNLACIFNDRVINIQLFLVKSEQRWSFWGFLFSKRIVILSNSTFKSAEFKMV